MQFSDNQAIYLQIADLMMENILRGQWKEDERIPSVRDLAISLSVNPNTIMRSYMLLEQRGVIFNQRGIGYFVSPSGGSIVLNLRREDFVNNELPRVFGHMELLGIGMDDVVSRYQQFKARPREKGNGNEKEQ